MVPEACLNVVSRPHGDVQLEHTASVVGDCYFVDDLWSLARVLDRERARGQRALQLIGHSSSGDRLLWLGETLLSADDEAVISFFRRRRDQLHALEVRSIRLLGCFTALRPQGRAALRAIARATELDVFGSISGLSWTAYEPGGLRPEYAAAYLVDQHHTTHYDFCPLD